MLGPSLLAALLLDWMCAQRRLLPPGFRVLWRRVLAGLAVATLLAVGVFAPLGGLGMKTSTPDLDKVTTPQLFLLHVLMLATMGIWFLLGFAGEDARPPRRPPSRRRSRSEAEVMNALVEPVAPPRHRSAAAAGPPRTAVPGAVRLSGAQRPARDRAGAPARHRRLGRRAAGADGGRRGGLGAGRRERRPQGAAGHDPVHRRAAGPDVRFLISLSAGVVEESFFRGFLQPRIGIFALDRCSSSSPTSPTASRSC